MTSRKRRSRRRSGSSNFNLLLGGCGALLAIVALLQYMSPESQHYRAQQAAAKREQDAASRIAVEIASKARIEATQAELQDQRAAREAEIAHARYRAACTLLTAHDLDSGGYEYQAIALSEGVIYRDGNSGGRLISGSIYCDDKGNTAKWQDGRFVEFARATDPDLWNKRFEDALGWHELARRSKVGE